MSLPKKKSPAEALPPRAGRVAPVRIRFRLSELMAERGIEHVTDLAERACVSRNAIGALKNGTWQRVDRETLTRLCGALDATVGDLFVTEPADIWFPIRLRGEVTIHLGSISKAVPRAGGQLVPCERIEPQLVGYWDVRSLSYLMEHLARLAPRVTIRLREHMSGSDSRGRTRVDELFEGGNHIILGSPLVNPIAEEVVCRCYKVAPRMVSPAAEIPYWFSWQSWQSVASSFGESGEGRKLGVVRSRDRTMVARRTVVKEGRGEDCGLLLSYRRRLPPARRQYGRDDECIIIAILGHSGCGTLAGTWSACEPEVAARLYPSERNTPLLRTFRAGYLRSASSSSLDNREPFPGELLPE
jgi:DNA-binding Xre family transcriptional regulator